MSYVYTKNGNKIYRLNNTYKEYIGNQSYEPIGDKETALVMGAGGFIGSHMVKRLKREGFWVRGVDLKYPEFSKTEADDFIIGDLTDLKVVEESMNLTVDWVEIGFDELYQFAADMGGAGYIFTGDNDSNVMHNSGQINLNVVKKFLERMIKKIFYSSSACMYPEHNQLDPDNPNCTEDSAYPANPDSEYGWEKLFSERLYKAYERNHGLNIRIARFHNIFGPEGTWDGGREKAPAAMCRKAIMAEEGGEIEVWGDGKQTRSFLFIDECVEAVWRLMKSEFNEPVNIGSEEMISINDFAQMAIDISGKDIKIKNIDVPQIGVRGRNSDNTLYRNNIGWSPNQKLSVGMKKTYQWIKEQINE